MSPGADYSDDVAYQRTHSVKSVVNEGEDDEIECTGYKTVTWKQVLCALAVLLSLGFLLLVFYWRKDWYLRCVSSRISLSEATAILIKGSCQKQDRVSKVIKIDVHKNSLDIDVQGILRQDVLVNGNLRYFVYQKLKYIWDPNESVFKKLRALDHGVKLSEFYENFNGLTIDEQNQRRFLYGDNAITIKVRSYFVLLIQEVLHPFYVFQLFSVILWFTDEYYYYAVCIVIMSTFSITVSLYTTRTQSVMLHDMVKSSCSVTVSRGNGDIEDVWERELVPGDVLIIPPHGCSMTCDAVLLSGNCIVNESMLTGESVPVTKTPLPHSVEEGQLIYNSNEYKRHTLFCGTEVIQTRFYGSEKVKAVVVSTGFNTAKGTLVRAILYPKPMDIKLYRDSMRFIGVMFLLATIGFIYTVIILASQGSTAKDIVLKSLDIITIAIPPALPAALTIGIVYAQNRLKKQKIYCISPTRINLCGTVDVFCFDKTGTLTEDGLDLMGIVPVTNSSFEHMTMNIPFGKLLVSMTTCHSLTHIKEELTGDPLDVKMFEATKWILEEPSQEESSNFDILMPTLVKPPPSKDQESNIEIGVVHQFPFSSSLQRMSVITRTLGDKNMEVYVKGSPEKISSLCDSQTEILKLIQGHKLHLDLYMKYMGSKVVDTVPDNFHDVLINYTQQGLRVIALAWKPLHPSVQWHKALKMPRVEVECDLQFLGLLIMQNKLKPETTPVIKELTNAQIRLIMVTGDNILTAICVARECGLLPVNDEVIMIDARPPDEDKYENITWKYVDKRSGPNNEEDLVKPKESLNDVIIRMDDNFGHATYHFALDGKSFGVLRDYYSYLMPKIAVRGTVFARMSPDQKSQLVENLQELDYSVGMCGDGANDCGALKTAHAGISLSEAEASVASPFTSKIGNITCVPKVIREGRAALVTSFSMFKYMALYSIIQFVSVMILYSIMSNLGDIMFLYIDICIITVVAILMGRSEAYDKIVTKKPLTHLMTTPILVSILLQILVQVAIQTAAFYILKAQVWYEPLEADTEDYDANIVCYETTTIFLVSVFQYLIVAVAFSTGKPYTKPIYRNFLYTGALVLLTLVSIFIVLAPIDWLEHFFELRHFDEYYFRAVILAIALVNLALSLSVEFAIVPQKWIKIIFECRCCRKTIIKKKYETVQIEMLEDATWPPMKPPSYPYNNSQDAHHAVEPPSNHHYNSQDAHHAVEPPSNHHYNSQEEGEESSGSMKSSEELMQEIYKSSQNDEDFLTHF